MRPDGLEEPRGVGVAAVVGHLDDVGAQTPGVAQEAALCELLHVTGEQQSPARRRHPQDYGVVVVAGADRAVGRRAQHLDGGFAEREAHPGPHRHDRHPGALRGSVRGGHGWGEGLGVAPGRGRPDQERAHVQARQDRGQAGHMVVVGVAGHDRVEAAHPPPPQVGQGSTGLGAPVVEQAGGRVAGHLDEQRVALPDGERGHGQRVHRRRRAHRGPDARRHRQRQGAGEHTPSPPDRGEPGDEQQCGDRRGQVLGAQDRAGGERLRRPQHDGQGWRGQHGDRRTGRHRQLRRAGGG
ncbi:MAG: hypothetical protein WD080_03965 [Egibacteraceae bacterium]